MREYQVARHISAGRFGTTALVKLSSRLAVMKTVEISRLDPALTSEVVEEVAALAAVRHPHILPVIECFRQQSVVSLVFEYAEAANVAARVAEARERNVSLREELVQRWFTQILLAMKHIHDRGALHRDLRTRRALLTPQGNVLLSGLAVSALLARRLVPEAPDPEAVRYTAPELVAADTIDHSVTTDMWAVGVVLFEMLALKAPYEHSHPRGLVERILSGSPNTIPARGDPELRDVCTELLQRAPDERPSASEVLKRPAMQMELRHLLNSGPQRKVGPENAPRVVAQVPLELPLSQQFRPATTPRKACLSGSLLLAGPTPTPRSLRSISETCGRRTPTMKELATPRALQPRRLTATFGRALEKRGSRWTPPQRTPATVSLEAASPEQGPAKAQAWVGEVASPVTSDRAASVEQAFFVTEERHESELELKGRLSLVS